MMIQFVCTRSDWEDVPDDRHDTIMEAYDAWGDRVGDDDGRYPMLLVLHGEEVVDEIDTAMIYEISGGGTKIATIEQHRY